MIKASVKQTDLAVKYTQIQIVGEAQICRSYCTKILINKVELATSVKNKSYEKWTC